MRLIFYAILCCLWLAGCEQHLYRKDEKRTVVASPAIPIFLPTDGPAPPAAAPAAPGIALAINGKIHHLLLRARTDSTRPLTTLTYFSDDDRDSQHSALVRGYDGSFTFTLRDAAGQRVFERQLRKADFAKVGTPDIVVESTVSAPVFLGYSAALRALIFTVDFAVPDSDDGFQAVLLLGLKGQVLRLSEGRGLGGGPDCDAALAPGGRAVLTSSEIIRPNQTPLRLARAGADLAGAFFLTDSTVLAVYDPGKNQPVRLPDGLLSYERRATRQQQQAPNAFVVSVANGRTISKFRYRGYYEGMGYSVPHHCLPATNTCYLLDEKQGLYLLPLAAPGAPVVLKFADMLRFASPQGPQEVRFEMQGEDAQFAFYADATHLRRVRYQRLQD